MKCFCCSSVVVPRPWPLSNYLQIIKLGFPIYIISNYLFFYKWAWIESTESKRVKIKFRVQMIHSHEPTPKLKRSYTFGDFNNIESKDVFYYLLKENDL